MSSFKRPMQYRRELAEESQDKEDDWADELGFDSDEISDEESSDDNDGEGEEEKDDGGVNFVQFLGLRAALKSATEQRIKLHQDLNVTRREKVRVENELEQSEQRNKLQRTVLANAQKKELGDMTNTVDSLTLSMEELKAGDNETQGLMKMASQISQLTKEKREFVEKAGLLEADLQVANEQMSRMAAAHKQELDDLDVQIKELQAQVDPVKNAMAGVGGGTSVLDQEEIDRLREEAKTLRSQLRDAQEAIESGTNSGNITSEEATKFQTRIRELEDKNAQLKRDLGEAKSNTAKIEALQSSDADKEKLLRDELLEVQEKYDQEKQGHHKTQRKLDETSEKLTEESATKSRLEMELNDLKSSLEEQQKQLSQSGDSQKTVELRLSSVSQELATEKSSHKSEKEAHKQTKSSLDNLKKELQKVKDEMDSLQSDTDSKLRSEKQKFAESLQKMKADCSAEVAEVKQRAEENMHQLKEKLAVYSKQIEPAMASLSVLAAEYKKLKKQTRDLQGEIAPTVKQCKRDLLRTLAEVDKQYKEMLMKYRKEMAERKKLHNQLVDLRGNIRVFGRIRPIIHEDGKGSNVEIAITGSPIDDQIVSVQRKGKEITYELDKVFTPQSTQEDVFDAVKDVITSVVDGYNVCIFAYGQTGSGKTFTMDGPDENPGVNRRSLQLLFGVVEERKNDWSFELEVSVFEIYNNMVSDLLSGKRKKGDKRGLDIRYGKHGPYVEGLSRQIVNSPEEVREYFLKATKNRSTSATDMNEHSSRSHMLLVVYVSATNLSTGITATGKLNLIDLAGSERVVKSGAIDDKKRFSEATNINKSLSCLMDVIHALASKQKHIPYRNSKLTHLLQDSLGGSAKTIMVVQVAPVVKNVDESKNSLDFAKRVRSVELGSAKKTQETAEMTELRKEVRALQEKLKKGK
eukprot:m.58169 g.58169  ORF g.58169 m.58169 type:complete len:919 (+) comp11246_c0_seq1:43-2799(+)